MRKTFLILATALALFALLGFLGRPAYRHYKELTALRRARSFLVRTNYPNALLSARQALLLNPTNLEACAIMARLAQLADSPQLLLWRRRIADLSPTTQNKLKLASAALRFEAPPCNTASESLASLDDSAKHCAAYHVVAAELALKLNKPDIAQSHFLEACRLEPTNESHQLNLAVLQLSVERPERSNQTTLARATLERLRANTNFALVALRSLIADALLRTNLPGAECYSSQLLSQTKAESRDWIRHLTILQQQSSPSFASSLQAAQRSAAANPDEAYTIASWMTANGMAPDALTWLRSLPDTLQLTMPVPLALGDALAAQRDWRALEEFLEGKNWDQLEFVRLGWLARAAAEHKRFQTAETHWRTALRQAGKRLGALLWLRSIARQAGQPPEQVLWRIVHEFPTELWAWNQLRDSYVMTRNTAGLNLLYSELATCQPENFVAKNNFAVTSMLLKRNLGQAFKASRDLYVRRTEDPVIVSTYAYSLHLQGNTKEGLAALETCPPAALETPSVAFYYALLLAADGQTNKAAIFLALTNPADLLPEEQQLALTVLNAPLRTERESKR